jgi:hypothetical protein
MLNQHVEEIKALLENFEQEAHKTQIKGDANWTYEIKSRLSILGRNHNYKICASGFKDECEPEWLYDFVWYKEEGEKENARLIDVPLVLESEWNLKFEHIKYDFEKLLLANARLKVMLCQAHINNRQHRLDYFNDAIAKYQKNVHEEVYLIAILDYESEKFYFEVIKK